MRANASQEMIEDNQNRTSVLLRGVASGVKAAQHQFQAAHYA